MCGGCGYNNSLSLTQLKKGSSTVQICCGVMVLNKESFFLWIFMSIPREIYVFLYLIQFCLYPSYI